VTVEIMSVSSGRTDAKTTVREDLTLAALSDYLIVDGENRIGMHHACLAQGSARSQVVTDGAMVLPAGSAVDIGSLRTG
jgi:hypothetical protein